MSVGRSEFEALFLQEAGLMRDQERGGVGDRQVADLDLLIEFLFLRVARRGHQAARRGERGRRLKELAPVHARAEHASKHGVVFEEQLRVM